MEISDLQRQVFRTALEHGWWPFEEPQPGGPDSDVNTFVQEIDYEAVNIPEKLALMHSELSEALEFYRNLDEFKFRAPVLYSGEFHDKPDGFWIELADCIIRILDLAGAYGIDMEYLLRVKAEYNQTRPYRHGDKKC
jgi:NTP pyrophosphatase (non-canonical NTP hydrolase)